MQTIKVCCKCEGSGTIPAGRMKIDNDYKEGKNKGFTFTSQTICPECKGSGYGKC